MNVRQKYQNHTNVAFDRWMNEIAFCTLIMHHLWFYAWGHSDLKENPFDLCGSGWSREFWVKINSFWWAASKKWCQRLVPVILLCSKYQLSKRDTNQFSTKSGSILFLRWVGESSFIFTQSGSMFSSFWKWHNLFHQI